MRLMNIKRTILYRLILVLMVFFVSVVAFTAADDYIVSESDSCAEESACPVTEFPSPAIPVVVIIGSVGGLLYIQSLKVP